MVFKVFQKSDTELQHAFRQTGDIFKGHSRQDILKHSKSMPLSPVKTKSKIISRFIASKEQLISKSRTAEKCLSFAA